MAEEVPVFEVRRRLDGFLQCLRCNLPPDSRLGTGYGWREEIFLKVSSAEVPLPKRRIRRVTDGKFWHRVVLKGSQRQEEKALELRKRHWMHVAITWSFSSSENDFKAGLAGPVMKVGHSGSFSNLPFFGR